LLFPKIFGLICYSCFCYFLCSSIAFRSQLLSLFSGSFLFCCSCSSSYVQINGGRKQLRTRTPSLFLASSLIVRCLINISISSFAFIVEMKSAVPVNSYHQMILLRLYLHASPFSFALFAYLFLHRKQNGSNLKISLLSLINNLKEMTQYEFIFLPLSTSI